MKNIKRFFSMILIVCTVLCCVNVYAADSDYTCSRITYSNGLTTVTALNADETVKASITVSKSGDAKSLMFMSVLYRNNRLIDCSNVDVKPVGSTPATFAASVGIPTDTAGLKLVSMLWEDVSGMKSVCQSSLFPGGGTDLMSIKVDGVEVNLDSLDQTTGNLDCTIPVNKAAAPLLEAVAVDGGTEVIVTPPPVKFPGTTTITGKAADGVEKTYTITYKPEKPCLTGIEAYSGQETRGQNSFRLNKGFDVGLNINYDLTYTISTIHSDYYELLKGCDWIMYAINTDKISPEFRLYRDATVYVFGRVNANGNDQADDEAWGECIKGKNFITTTAGASYPMNMLRIREFSGVDPVNGTQVTVPWGYAPNEDSCIVIKYKDYITE